VSYAKRGFKVRIVAAYMNVKKNEISRYVSSNVSLLTSAISYGS
jgi:hypothetical protein